MILQNLIWTLALIGIAFVALIFLWVLASTRHSASEGEVKRQNRRWHVFQAWFFVVLVLALVGGSWATLHKFPIPLQNTPLAADVVVDVEGRMWSWDIAPAQAQVGQTVEFRVTSVDVNHGFALYGPGGQIVTQTQAMPEYVNKLLYTFEEPGTYVVQCLEYCGLGHALMESSFIVRADGED